MKHSNKFFTILLCLCLSLMARADDRVIAIRSTDIGQSIFINDRLFTNYVQSIPGESLPRPFLYPVIGPTGAEMTRNYPMKSGIENEATDHIHHRSLWFTHGSVNGVDFWTEQGRHGLIRTDSITVITDGHDSFKQPIGMTYPVLLTNESWIAPDGKEHVIAQNIHSFGELEDGARFVDTIRIHQVGSDVEQAVFGDTKEGTMAIRTHPALRLKGPVATGHCINSEGDKDGAAWGKRAKWVAYWGVIDGKTCGIAVFDHPTNLRHPTWWHARDYGLIAANPFGIHDFEKGQPRGTGDFTLEAGQTLSLRYRFVFFAGTAEEADIAGKYDAWVAETTEQEENEEE